MHFVIGSDHAGFTLKGAVIAHLRDNGHEVEDIGTYSTDPVDYPPICADVARAGGPGRRDRLGIVIGGSGQGEAIAANKVHGARAALCHDEYTARFARRHNDANVLSLGARLVATELALDIVDVFVATALRGWPSRGPDRASWPPSRPRSRRARRRRADDHDHRPDRRPRAVRPVPGATGGTVRYVADAVVPVRRPGSGAAARRGRGVRGTP